MNTWRMFFLFSLQILIHLHLPSAKAVKCVTEYIVADSQQNEVVKDGCRYCGKNVVIVKNTEISVNYTCETTSSADDNCSNSRVIDVDADGHDVVMCTCCSDNCNGRLDFCGNTWLASMRRLKRREVGAMCGQPFASNGPWNPWIPGAWSCWHTVPQNLPPQQQQFPQQFPQQQQQFPQQQQQFPSSWAPWQQQQQQQTSFPFPIPQNNMPNSNGNQPSSNIGGPVQAVQINSGGQGMNGGGSTWSQGFSWPPGQAPNKWIHVDLSIVGAANSLQMSTATTLVTATLILVIFSKLLP